MLDPFEVLFEEALPGYDLPPELGRIYGRFGFGARVLYSNFVSSLDGVVSLGSKPSAGSAISGRNEADRFLMGLLRACADAVVLGAGTLRATPGHRWTAAHMYPDAAADFAALRKGLGRSGEPRLVLLTTGRDVDVSHPAVVDGATFMTSTAGARVLRERLPSSCDVIEIGEHGEVDLRRGVDELHARGHEVLLTEGGPHVMGELVRQGLLDEAFLTISPVLAGRGSPSGPSGHLPMHGEEQRLGMVAGIQLLPDAGVWTRLLSARRHGSFLFLRYGLRD